MKIRAVSHVGLTVSNFEDAVKWYHRHFGFKLIDEKYLGKEQVSQLEELYGVKDTVIRLGFLRSKRGDVIEIFEFRDKGTKEKVIWNKPGFTHTAFDVKNIKKAYTSLKNQGIYFYGKPQNTEGTEWVFMQDPDGNLIELIDLKANFWVIRILGGLAGSVMKRTKFKTYYK